MAWSWALGMVVSTGLALLGPPMTAEEMSPDRDEGAEPEAVAPNSPVQGLLDQASIRGVVFDEGDRSPGTGLRVGLTCAACTQTQRWATTRAGGRFDFYDLEPGEYTVVVHASGGAVMRQVELEAGGEKVLALATPRAPRIEKDAKGRIIYRTWSSDAEERAAQIMLGAGGVALVIASGMTIGAIVEAKTPGCEYNQDFGCDAAPRPQVINGLAVGAIVTGVGGGVLLAAGLIKRRRHRVTVAPTPVAGGAALHLGMRF